MFAYLSQYSELTIFFNLFRYITFRSGGAFITALVICFMIGSPLITWLKHKQRGANNVREDLPEQHFTKIGTPTMGGLMILISMLISHIIMGGFKQCLYLDDISPHRWLWRNRFC